MPSSKKKQYRQSSVNDFFNPKPTALPMEESSSGESVRSYTDVVKAGEKKRGLKTNIIILSSSEPDETLVVSRRVSVASSTVQDNSTFANTTTRTNTPPSRDLAVEDLARSIGKLRPPSSAKSHCIFTESPNMIPPSPINFGMDEEDADLQEALRQSINDTRRREIYGDSAAGPSSSRSPPIQRGTVSNTRSYASALLNIPNNDNRRYPTALRSLLDQGPQYRTVSPPRPTAIGTHLFDEATTRALQREKISSKQADALMALEAVPDDFAEDVAAPEEERAYDDNDYKFDEKCVGKNLKVKIKSAQDEEDNLLGELLVRSKN